jgi:arylsulfatase A-like enzyme
MRTVRRDQREYTMAVSSKPNIIMIMADDVGIWNIRAYHRGMMGGSTPNIDRLKRRCVIH